MVSFPLRTVNYAGMVITLHKEIKFDLNLKKGLLLKSRVEKTAFWVGDVSETKVSQMDITHYAVYFEDNGYANGLQPISS